MVLHVPFRILFFSIEAVEISIIKSIVRLTRRVEPRQVPQACHVLSFFLTGVRALKTLSGFDVVLPRMLLFHVSSIFAAVFLFATTTHYASGGRSLIVVLRLVAVRLSEMRLHVIWAARHFIGSRRLLVGTRRSDIADSHLFYQIKQKWLRRIFLASEHPAFSRHFISLLWEVILSYTHLRQEN